MKKFRKNLSPEIEDKLLATHVSNNSEFAAACLSGDAEKIIEIVNLEMIRNHLYTKGSVKLKNDILKMTQGKSQITTYLGERILFFVWNSRLSGIGLAVN